MKYRKKSGLLKSFGYAVKGIMLMFEERNFLIQFATAVAVVLMGLWLKLSALEWFVAGFFIVLVLALEMLNSALENLADAVTEEKNEKIKRAKDMAAGAVLLAAVAAATAGVFIFFPKLWNLIF